MRIPQLLLICVIGCSLVADNGVQSTNASESDHTSSEFLSTRSVETLTIPAGSRLRVALIDGVSTTRSSPGDAFEASLVEPVIVDGQTILEKGTKLRGHVAEVEESGRLKGRASLRLILSAVVLNGDAVAIYTKPFLAVADGTKARDEAVIGGGTLIGGEAGAGAVLAAKGKDLHYPPETRLNFTLASSVQIPG